MKIYAYPADLYGCGHYRLIWPAEQVRRLGIDVEMVMPGSTAQGIGALQAKDGTITGALAPPDADAIIVQRPSNPILAGAIKFWREKGIAVIVDIDDDLSHIHPQNVAFAAMHPNPQWEFESAPVREAIAAHAKSTGLPIPQVYGHYLRTRTVHSWAAVKEAARDATMVTVSTPSLLDRYGRGHSVVLANYLPARMLQTVHHDSDQIGWAGSTHSHPGDLRAIGGGLHRVVDGGNFLVVGDGTGADRDLGCMVESTGPIPFDDWITHVACIGIGVAPLQDSRFNEAKSWLKPLEYCAAGVPWVASPRNEYRAIQQYGAGLLAERPKEWVRQLKLLRSSPSLRQEQTEAGRHVAATMTIEGHAWRFAEAWTAAVEVEHRNRLRRGEAILA